MANINDFNRIKVVELGNALDGIEAGTGTFKEILDNVYSGVIKPLTKFGEIIGIDFNSGKTGALDSIEQQKFTIRYSGKDVMLYVLKALQLYASYTQINDVIEDDEEGIYVITNEGEKIVIEEPYMEDEYDEDFEDYEEYDEEETSNACGNLEWLKDAKLSELPDKVRVPIDELNGFTTDHIKDYLRDKADRYLARDCELNYYISDKVVIIEDIKWGRKR